MKDVFMLAVLFIFCMGVMADGVPIPSFDIDRDGVLDFTTCKLGDNELECKDKIDNCTLIKNSKQYVSPSYANEETQLGTACDYDFNADGFTDISDYGWLVNVVNAYTQACFDYLTFTYRDVPHCAPQARIGDLTGGWLYPSNVEVEQDGRLTHSDTCAFLSRNPDVWEQVLLPPTSCIEWR